jgi:hypothetical protein
MASPITTNAQQLAALQAQLGNVIESKGIALAKINSCNNDGPNVNYAISGKAGAESVSATEYLSYLKNQVKEFVELEALLMDLIQRLQPYIVTTRLSLA